MITKSYTLPTEDDLTVEEIDLSTPSFRAGAYHLGKYCETPSKEFVLCKREEDDPRRCVAEGKILTSCGMEFFRKVKGVCLEEFSQFARCIDKSSVDYQFTPCRNTQAVFDKCMLEKLSMPKPSYDYYCRAKVLDTKRPKPRGYLTPDFPNEPEPVVIPAASELPDAKHGSRLLGYP